MNKFLMLLIGAILGIIGFLYLIHGFHNLHITAVFDELEPFPKNLNVYYKGFKLGRSVRVHPSDNFTKTHVDMILSAKNLKLPDNITAKVRTRNKKDYIEIDYPSAPSVTYLKNHSVIEGKKGVDIGDYIDMQAEGGGLDEIKENLNVTVQSAGETLEALTGLISTADEILKDLQPELKETGQNLVEMSQNLVDVTGELNRSTKPQRLQNTFANIEQTTFNIERATRNFETTTLNINDLTSSANKQTVALVNCILSNINKVVLNTNDIVKGFKATLSKRFGGMRLFLGKPID